MEHAGGHCTFGREQRSAFGRISVLLHLIHSPLCFSCTNGALNNLSQGRASVIKLTLGWCQLSREWYNYIWVQIPVGSITQNNCVRWQLVKECTQRDGPIGRGLVMSASRNPGDDVPNDSMLVHHILNVK